MSCASSCTDGPHTSYGACLRSKNLAAVGLETTAPSFGMTRQKAFDRNLDRYEAATRQGIQPATTQDKDIAFAVKASEEHGKAFRADL